MKKKFLAAVITLALVAVLLVGCKGAEGLQGLRGPAGPQGEQGTQGEVGPQGEFGPSGASGAKGPQGEPGSQGEIGPVGPEGPQGKTGAGAKGSAGATGPKGDTGPAGSDADCDALEVLIGELEARLYALETLSSTMKFEGTLTDEGGGVFTGTIDMTIGDYYVPGGNGEVISDLGGFDVFAKAGGIAYVEGMSPDNWVIGSDHDAYSKAGPWGSWYDPDCADWNQYSLELTADHWYLRYTATMESPMSGEMDWGAMYAAETDPGTVKSDHGGTTTDPTEYTAGSAQEWGWHCGWGEERIPLQLSGFAVQIIDLGSTYCVTLTPAPAP